MSNEIQLTPEVIKYDVYNQDLIRDVWNDKYRWDNEADMEATCKRSADSIRPGDHNAAMMLRYGLFMPGGRILAGAGTDKIVTLMNCYVMRDIPDALAGIADVHKDSMVTMQQGGGIGMNFTTLRPKGAWLKRTQAHASGPLPFMDMWDTMCATMKSAGGRRGAMMATMWVHHPDIFDFVLAKKEKGRLTNFNMSVMISNEFMDAVINDTEFHLKHEVASDGTQQQDTDGLYIYRTIRAVDLWDLILETTYEYAEPGILFMDRINERNNLRYCETINATNPCGEQPLPPGGACDLGAVNLSRLVLEPFTESACVNWEALKLAVHVGIEFLDSVLDHTRWPLDIQAMEGKQKRRIGLGVAGLGDMFHQMRMRYGSPESVELTTRIFRTIANESYATSALLAKEKGAFPLYDAEQINRHMIEKLEGDVQQMIHEHGLRNGTNTTIAPTGTTAIAYGNITGGVEPTHEHEQIRNVLQEDNTTKPYTNYGFSAGLYKSIHGADADLPDYMVTSEQITIEEHIAIQAAAQEWVDSSISKTTNCPKDMTFDEFKNVYMLAWVSGLKGITTYRPSGVRGAVLEKVPELKPEEPELWTRPEALQGTTYKLKWPHSKAAWYVTITDDGERLREVFISSKNNQHLEWTTALTRTIASIMRMTPDIDFLIKELREVTSVGESAIRDQKFQPSLVAYIGHTMQKHTDNLRKHGNRIQAEWEPEVLSDSAVAGRLCSECKSYSVIQESGCDVCKECGYSTCG